MKNKAVKIFSAAVFWIAIWEILCFLISENLALFLPGPLSVIKTFFRILPTELFLKSVGTTLLRVFAGLIIGFTLGVFLGILTEEFKIADILISPALKVIRAVPVVSFIILAFLFIKVDILPVFISLLMVIPLVWQSVYDALNSTDIKLKEMATVYNMGKIKTLLYIKLPCSSEQIISSLINATGLAWKSGIAAEVLCTPIISIGKNIYTAKANLSFDEVYAWTLTVVILSIVFELLLKYIWKKHKNKEVSVNA